MAAGIRTSTTTDWLTNAGIAPSSDRTALGRTLRLSAPDRSPAGNAWCLGSPRESRARQATPLSPSEPHFVGRTEEPPVLKMKWHCGVSYRERACDLPREMHFLAVIRLASNHNRSNPSCERMKIRVRLLHTLRPVLSADPSLLSQTAINCSVGYQQPTTTWCTSNNRFWRFAVSPIPSSSLPDFCRRLVLVTGRPNRPLGTGLLHLQTKQADRSQPAGANLLPGPINSLLLFSAWPSASSAQSKSACVQRRTSCAVSLVRPWNFAQLLGSYFPLGRGAWARCHR